MFLSAMIPLLFVELLFYFQYESPVRHSEHSGIDVEADRVRQDYELFLQKRLSGLRSLAAFYEFGQLSDSVFLAERLRILKEKSEDWFQFIKKFFDFLFSVVMHWSDTD